MKIAASVTDLVGNTPLVRINRITAGCKAEVVAKAQASVSRRCCGKVPRYRTMTWPDWGRGAGSSHLMRAPGDQSGTFNEFGDKAVPGIRGQRVADLQCHIMQA